MKRLREEILGYIQLALRKIMIVAVSSVRLIYPPGQGASSKFMWQGCGAKQLITCSIGLRMEGYKSDIGLDSNKKHLPGSF